MAETTSTVMETSTDPCTLGSNIAMVRRLRGVSQDVLAQEIDVTRQTLASYEKDTTSPSTAVVRRIAKALEFPFEPLFNEIKPFDLFNYGFKVIDSSFEKSVQYRREASLDDEILDMVKHVAFDKIRYVLELEDILDSKIEFVNPVKSMGDIDSKDKAEEAALEVRRKWGIYENPFANVVGVLENRGVKVVEFRGPAGFEGLSARYDGNPIVVLNSAIEEVTRKRFTALHELGHLILQIPKHVKYEVVESICNAFASMLILPKELLWRELGQARSGISLQELNLIKQKYGISIRAILVSAAFANIISWEKKRLILEELDGKSIVNFSGDETALRHKQLLYRAVAENKIGQDKYEQLGGSVDMFNELIAL
ncbi:XRE family transcriptional regulator [Dawidia soli]|uniref:ImmA/IrrE family metallo-endopeptidase n=1 Tax=Dawidia soli TaxID=2782352 RepID=A0AAP2GH94_9BACT|nr:XRE family transcriptional regulator [Dawidia soli]MBT1686180.1 ImmA/IrrE family metallo-endopeptidase [Dawidia soli]